MRFMVSTDRLVAFAALSFLLIAIPGPTVLFMIGRALAQGRRAARTTVVRNQDRRLRTHRGRGVRGRSVGERSVLAFTVLKLAAAASLAWVSPSP